MNGDVTRAVNRLIAAACDIRDNPNQDGLLTARLLRAVDEYRAVRSDLDRVRDEFLSYLAADQTYRPTGR